MKKKILKIAALVIAIALIIGVCWFANGLVGNPISKSLATRTAEKYIEENFPNTDFELERVTFSFKDTKYHAYIVSPSSADSSFSLTINMGGKIVLDLYENNVLTGWNTARRLGDAYREAVDQVLESPSFPYDCHIGFGDLEFIPEEYKNEPDVPSYALITNELELDGIYDILYNKISLRFVAGILWLAGIAAMLLYTAVSYFLLRRRVATAVLLRNNIYQSENVDSPFVLGIIKPKIYLPFQMDGKNLEHVIAHEESHIRRKDHWWKPFGFVLLALHWFNPLMWLGYILLCRDIELACDEKVIKEMDNENRADYTQALVACSVNRRRIAACPLAFGEVGVKERVKSVMNYKKPAFWIIVAAVVTCVAVAVCFLTNPLNRVSLSELKSDEINMPGILDDITGMIVTYEGISVACPEQADVNRFLATMEKIDVSRDWITTLF